MAFRPCYISHEWENITGSVDLNIIMQRENLKVRDMSKPFTLYYRMRRQARPAEIAMDGNYLPTNGPKPTQRVVFFNNGTWTGDRGTIITTFYISCKERI